MLSSPRWTALDLCAVVALVALTARVFGWQAEAMYADRGMALAQTLSAPLPDHRSRAALEYRERLDAVLRCAGLGHLDTGRTAPSLAPVAALQRRFTVRNPDGTLGQHLRRRIGAYAAAYAALRQSRTESSQLILRRDSAMCNRYPEFREAGLHEQQERQSRRSVQEGAG